MPARITQSALARSALADLSRQRLRMFETQRQVSSGLRITRPSDDPAGTAAAHVLRTGIAATDQFRRNADMGASRVAASESAVASTTDLLIRARELAIAGSNDTQDAVSRRAIAREIEGIHAAMLAQANSTNSRGYLFAGFAADVPPFVSSGPFVETPPTSPTVTYVGDGLESQVAIDEGMTVQVGFDGREIFLGDADGNGVTDPGAADVFEVLSSLWTALQSDDGAAVAQTLSGIDTVLDQVSLGRSRMAASEKLLEDWKVRLDQRVVDLEARLSEVQDADLAEVVSKLVQQETALNAGLQAMSRIITPSLMDFLS